MAYVERWPSVWIMMMLDYSFVRKSYFGQANMVKLKEFSVD